MIKENQKLLNRIQVVLDAGVIIVAYVLSWYIRFRSGLFDLDPWYLSLREYMKVLFFLVPSYLILYYAFQLYTPKRVQGRRLEAWHVVQANVIGLMGVTMVFFPCKAFRQIFQMGSIYLLLCQYYHGSICQKYGEDGFAQGEKERI